jgi:hypothetical protein
VLRIEELKLPVGKYKLVQATGQQEMDWELKDQPLQSQFGSFICENVSDIFSTF